MPPSLPRPLIPREEAFSERFARSRVPTDALSTAGQAALLSPQADSLLPIHRHTDTFLLRFCARSKKCRTCHSGRRASHNKRRAQDVSHSLVRRTASFIGARRAILNAFSL